ncbi:ABC transporter substrate-binding protein [Paenibacillus oceani]|uniref:Carbohydrate ABC transporter substrate-binding protein n=1 Tax=Paenibacillus oceani TaxID=2772510 RepID=A0A927C9A8_9BACL|nr:ABC transporter substrate-binding protein [Paenibacillus oceani]MBD2862478.1 carbohydrate ABC transporter substrate-binding protein [Paenibacillus oceani]
MKKIGMALCTLGVSLLATGCFQDAKENEDPTLKVMFGSEQSFYRLYGDTFAAKFPNLDVEIVVPESSAWANVKDYSRFVETERPDLLILNPSDYDFLASNKLLLDLSTHIKRSGFDLDSISPVVVTYLKSATNDVGLYGLTRSFTSNVLVYNKELFERYGLAEPTGSMSWEQLYKLMDHFNRTALAGERIYGYEALNNMHPFHFVQTIASSGGLSFVHVETRQVTLNTTGWRNAIQLVTDAISSGALGGKRAQEGARNYMTEANLFARGKAALKDGNFQTVSEWINNPPPFRWGITGAVAYNPSEEATASLFSSDEIFAISAKADHKENAWRVIQYLNSDELARAESGMRNGMLPARQDYAPEIAGHDVGLFYRIASPGPSVKRDPLFDYLALPEAFTKVMASIILEEFDSVLDGKSTVEEALERMQLREQAALDEAVVEESKR